MSAWPRTAASSVRWMKAAFEKDLQALAATGEVEALTICLLNSYVNGAHEREAKAVAEKVFGDIPISISSDVVPEMQEYERTETTVLNSYVRPQVSKYVDEPEEFARRTTGR